MKRLFLLYSEHIGWRLGNYERILWAGDPVGACLWRIFLL